MKRVYPLEQACMGCGICEVACSERHAPGKDILKHYELGQRIPMSRIRRNEAGAFTFSLQCRHCSEPMCLYSCLTGAIYLEPDGTVGLDESKCIGCWTCVLACEYGAVERDEATGRAVKCDLCRGDEMPACVRACPNNGLIFSSSNEARERNSDWDGYPELSLRGIGRE